MPWVKIDAAAPTHPKLLKAGPIAGWLWLAGLCYCHTNRTDGFLPVASLSALYPLRYASVSARRLVAVGLWEVVDGGWRVHDYGKFQQSKAAIEEKQAHIHDVRADAGRKAMDARWAGHVKKTSSKRKKPIANGNAIAEQSIESKSTQGAHAPADEGPRDGHRKHVFCGVRFCVPRFIHEQFDRQLAGGGPHFDLLLWYPKVDAEDDTPVADIFSFLRDAFKAAVQAQFGTRATARASAPVYHEPWFCPHTPHCGHRAACAIVAAREKPDAIQGPG